MQQIVDDAATDASLRGWVEQLCGGRITQVQQISGGAFRKSCRVMLEYADGVSGCVFLKIDTGSAPKTPFNLRREYELLRRLDGQARAPRALGYHDQTNAMAMVCLSGEAGYSAIGDDTHRQRIERSFAEALVECHRVPVAPLALDYMPAHLTVREAILSDLDVWEELLLAAVPDPDPITLLALAWTRSRVPVDDSPAVLVQGDAGPGNFLFDSIEVTGVVDWEMAHLGHPLEDVGCILARSLVQPMAPADRLMEVYQAAAAREYSREALIYATILVMTRFSVPIELSLASRHTGLDLGLTSSYFRLSQISLLRLIAEAEDIPLQVLPSATGGPPAISFEFDYLCSVLTSIIKPALEDPYARYRLEGAVGLLTYLREALVERSEASAPSDARTVISRYATMLGDRAALQQQMQAMIGEALRREQLMRGMLGPLHGNRVTI